ncbi:hypothetical protein [Sphingomonas sp. CROZ-RG-20F-R02-07]|uniref:hypothetical protein n=1 Tax=Sphingomonas sp. CROZ-RG-20F-R02-07 TaxID=2914832 RepID=UPI001F5889D8|nr:hypothetical protein [Sphingomonas sp. CROZ-RG-20F-R02-07]
MDRTGIFAVGASLVLLSALHMLNAPNYTIVVPVALFVLGVAKLLMSRPANGDAIDPSFSHSTKA